MSQDDDNPFSSPESDASAGSRECPACGREMESGELHSNSVIYWRSDEISTLKRFLTGGEKIGPTGWGLGCSYASFFCPACRIVVLRDRQVPGDG